MIVVTAPTSKIGRRVLEHVLAGDEPVRVVARDPGCLHASTRVRVEIVQGSHRDARVVDEAFAGADVIFWLMPADVTASGAVAAYVEASRPAADAVSRHGVPHVVGVSALGRGTPDAARAGNVSGSLAMDDLLAGTAHYRALANASFMDNTLRAIGEILEQGTISSPVDPERKLPLVATRDVAAVGARLLADRSWHGVAEVPLLGPEDLSGNDMARILSEVLAMPVRYQRIGAESVAAALRGRGASSAMAMATVEMMTAKGRGLDEGVARTPENTTSTTFRDWCTTELLPAVRAARG